MSNMSFVILSLITSFSLLANEKIEKQYPFYSELVEYCKIKNQFNCAPVEKAQPCPNANDRSCSNGPKSAEDSTKVLGKMLQSSCEKYYKDNLCDSVKAKLPEFRRQDVMTCNLDHLCDELVDLDKVSCTIDGVKAAFNWSTLWSVIVTGAGTALTGSVGGPSAVAGISLLSYEASKSEEECNKDIKFKEMMILSHNLTLLENEKGLDYINANRETLKMTCSELGKFLATRINVLVLKRNEKEMWSLNKIALKQSKEAVALKEKLESNKCFSPKALSVNACQSLAATLTGMAATFGSVKGGMKVNAKVAARKVKNGFDEAVSYQLGSDGGKPPINPLDEGVRRTSWHLDQLNKAGVTAKVRDTQTIPLKELKYNLKDKSAASNVKKLEAQIEKAKQELQAIEESRKKTDPNMSAEASFLSKLKDPNEAKYVALQEKIAFWEDQLSSEAANTDITPYAFASRTYDLDSPAIQKIRAEGGKGEIVLTEEVVGNYYEGSHSPKANKTSVSTRTNNAPQTLKHELDHARSQARSGKFKMTKDGKFESEGFDFEIAAVNRKDPNLTDNYSIYQHGSEVSAFRAGGKAFRKTSSYEAVENFERSTSMAERNIRALEQARELVRKKIAQGKDHYTDGAKGPTNVIEFPVTIDNGTQHILRIKRPPTDLNSPAPKSTTIEGYLDFLIRVQKQTIELNNKSMAELKKK